MNVNLHSRNYLNKVIQYQFTTYIRLLAIELFKLKNSLSNRIMSELFDLRNIEYNLLSQTEFSVGAVYTTNHGLRLLIYFAPKIWTIIPMDIRNVNNILDFTLKIKFWIPDRCPYNLPCQVGCIN